MERFLYAHIRLGRKDGDRGRGLLKTEEGRERGGEKKQVFSLANENGRSNVALISKFPVAPFPPSPTLWPPPRGNRATVRSAQDQKWRCPKKKFGLLGVRARKWKTGNSFSLWFRREEGKISGGYKREREKPIGHPEASRPSDSKAVVGGKAAGKSWSFEENR